MEGQPTQPQAAPGLPERGPTQLLNLPPNPGGEATFLTKNIPDQLRLLGIILSLVPQGKILGSLGQGGRLLANMAGQGAISGLAGALEGNSPADIGKEALTSSVWEIPGARFGGRAVQRGATKFGLKMGGLRASPKATDEILDAFERQSKMSANKGAVAGIFDPKTSWADVAERAKAGDILPTIHPGQPRKVTRRIQEGSKALETAERSIPGKKQVLEFSGYNEPSREKLLEGGVGASKSRTKLREAENAEINDQALNMRGYSSEALPTKNSPREIKNWFMDLLADPETAGNARFLGNTKRQAAHRASELIEARKAGNMDDLGDVSMMNLANLGNRARSLQYDLGNASGVDLEKINSKLSDLFTINKVNDILRGGGGVMTDLGQYGMRGGLGSGMAGSIVPRQLGPLATLIYASLLNPKGISRLGGLGKGLGEAGRLQRKWELMAGDEFLTDRER